MWKKCYGLGGVRVDHSTLQRWVFKFSPLIEANTHKRKQQVCHSWRMDETYLKVEGKDRYLNRAVAILVVRYNEQVVLKIQPSAILVTSGVFCFDGEF